MWSCKCDAGHVLQHRRQLLLSLQGCKPLPLRNPSLLSLVTLLLASSLSLISLIIVSYDVMKIFTVENVTLILFLCICMPHPNQFFQSHAACVIICVFCDVCTSLSYCLFVFVGSFWQHLVGLWLIWVYRALHSYSMQYMRVQGERARATLVIQCAHPHGPRLRGVHVLMKK